MQMFVVLLSTLLAAILLGIASMDMSLRPARTPVLIHMGQSR